MNLFLALILFLAGASAGVTLMLLFIVKGSNSIWLWGFREGLLCAADLLKDRGEFELYDTEGGGGGRLDRSRPLFEVELQLRSEASQIRDRIDDPVLTK